MLDDALGEVTRGLEVVEFACAPDDLDAALPAATALAAPVFGAILDHGMPRGVFAGSAVALNPKTGEVRERLAAAMRALLRHRGEGKTICPSDAARVVGGEDWRDLMPVAREVAGELTAAGVVVVTQKGEAVDVATARGPVRLAPGEALGL